MCHDGDLYGAQRSLELIVRHLPAQAYARFVSLARPGPLENRLSDCPNTQVLRHKRLQWVKHDIRTWPQRVGDATMLLWSVFSRSWALFQTIRREKIQLVHTNSLVSLEGPLAAALARVPHVWHIRELFMEPSPKLHMVLGRWFSRQVIDRLSDSVLCISDAVRRQFGLYAEYDPQRYQVVLNAFEGMPDPSSIVRSGPEFDRLRALCLKVLKVPVSDTLDGVFRIGYIGRISEGKGLHELLEAVHLLRRERFSVELLIAGDFVDEAYRDYIGDLLERYALESGIHFLGRLDNLEPVYAAIDAVVVPSLNEPFGRVVIETMCQGIPCVATAAGGIPEIIEHGVTGLLYPPGEPETLAGCLRDLIESPWKRESLQENAGRMVLQRFTIEQQIRKLDECYQSVLIRHQLC